MNNKESLVYKKKKTIYDSKLLCALLYLIFVKPDYFGEIEFLDRPFFWATFFATAFLMIAIIFSKKWTFAFWWTIIFFGIIFISTIMNGGELYKYCRTEFNIVGMCFMFDLWMKKSPITLLSASRILQVYIYINLITVILYPDGMFSSDLYSANWFLGYKNPQIRTILPIVSLSILYSYWKYNRINLSSYILIFVSLVTFLLIDSSTALVGFILFILLMVVFSNGIIPYPKILNISTSLLAVLALGIAIIFFSIQDNYETFFNDVLHRETDFTSRLTIWYDSVYRIIKQPLLGYGYMITDDFQAWYGFKQATHPHNFYLYVLIRGGFILLTVVIGGFLYANKIVMRYIEYPFAKVITFTLVCLMLMGLTEALTGTVMLYPMFILAMNAEELANIGFQIPAISKKNKIKKSVI